MICLICKEKPATEHFASFVGDKMQKLDLCADCKADAGLLQDVGVEQKCSHCGFALADFKKSGRPGCPACYKAFSGEFQGMLKMLHKGTRHTGKVPGRVRSVEVAGRRKSLEGELSLAVFLENFEDAARLRDAIKRLP